MNPVGRAKKTESVDTGRTGALLAAALCLFLLAAGCQKGGVPGEGQSTGTGDRSPLRIVSSDPADGDTAVAPGRAIFVTLEDTDGIASARIQVTIGGEPVAGRTDESGCPKGAAICRLLFTPSPPLTSDRQVDWYVETTDRYGNTSREDRSFHTAPASGRPSPYQLAEGDAPDTDGDGIPDAVESGLLKTNPNMRTLFVRPLKSDGTYWKDVKDLLTYRRAGSFGRTVSEIFAKKNIEIVIVGDPQNPYFRMKNNVGYSPATDPDRPPCGIITVTENDFCSTGCGDAAHRGHIHFDRSNRIWLWCTKGMTRSDDNGFGYHDVWLFKDSLANYFGEGAYHSLEKIDDASQRIPNRNPSTLDCYLDPTACATAPKSLLNEDKKMAPGKLLGIYACNDQGVITTGYSGGSTYDDKEVLARTLAHELGHALLNGYGCAATGGACAYPDWDDHCDNPDCIMCRLVTTQVGWGIKEFGGGRQCEHRSGGAKDIGAQGIVHNRVRQSQALAP